MDGQPTPNQKVQNAIDGAKLAFSIALGVAGFLFVPRSVWGACYFFMVGAMAVSAVRAKNPPPAANSPSNFGAPPEEATWEAPRERAQEPAPQRPDAVASAPRVAQREPTGLVLERGPRGAPLRSCDDPAEKPGGR